MQLFTHLRTVVHLSTAKGLNTRFSLVDPTCKCFVFTQKIEIVENKEQLFDFAIPFYFISLCFNALAVAKCHKQIFRKTPGQSSTAFKLFRI